MSEKLEKAAANFESAVGSLAKAVAGPKSKDVEIAGIIKMFEYTYETGWKVLKVMLEEQGIIAESPRRVFIEAFTAGLIDDEKKWLDIIEDRNLTSHTYKKTRAKKILKKIEKRHLSLFLKLKEKL